MVAPGLEAHWLGHSTVLLRLDGFTILTDPIFSEKAGLGLGPLTVGIKRLVPPALAISELPPVDLILLSHAHMDHFDTPSLRRLASKRTHIVTAPATSSLLCFPRRYASVQEVAWGETVRAGEAEVKALEVRHWGARMQLDTHRGYNGYRLSVGRWRVMFAGDTADTDAFRRQSEPAGVHVGIVPIGAYDPWIHAHCNPEQAWRMGNEYRADILLPVHHLTFPLSREGYYEPIERFHAAAGAAGGRIGWSRVGERFAIQ